MWTFSRYSRHLEQADVQVKCPWGRARSYAGEAPVCLPESHRPKWEPPALLQKGHKHFGSGATPHPRWVQYPADQHLNLLNHVNVLMSWLVMRKKISITNKRIHWQGFHSHFHQDDNWFSQTDKSTWTKLLYAKRVLLHCQTRHLEKVILTAKQFAQYSALNETPALGNPSCCCILGKVGMKWRDKNGTE